MWFEENEKNTCVTCRYGNKESNNRHCRRCISQYCLSNKKYTQWEKEGENNHDISLQWYARLREIFTYIKSHLLDIEKRISRNCKLLH